MGAWSAHPFHAILSGSQISRAVEMPRKKKNVGPKKSQSSPVKQAKAGMLKQKGKYLIISRIRTRADAQYADRELYAAAVTRSDVVDPGKKFPPQFGKQAAKQWIQRQDCQLYL